MTGNLSNYVVTRHDETSGTQLIAKSYRDAAYRWWKSNRPGFEVGVHVRCCDGFEYPNDVNPYPGQRWFACLTDGRLIDSTPISEAQEGPFVGGNEAIS